MARDRILLCLAHMSGKEQKYIQEAFDDNWVVPLGPNVNGFEEDLKKFIAPQSAPHPPKGGVVHSADPAYYDELKERAKKNRNNPTEAEDAMWSLLSRCRDNNKNNNKFRRQHIIGQYIVDFVCLDKMLVIDIDGGYHNNPEQIIEDRNRTEFLESQGYRVLRFKNEEVIGNTGNVLESIKCTLNAPFRGIGGLEVVALSAGTAAVHLALIACGVKAGDEVIVQTFTFCASSHPITYLGATPVFVDSEADTWNMDPKLLEEAIKDRIAKTGKKPKAIVPVYLYGMPAKIEEIMAVAEKYDIPVIEDAAEGLGSRYDGKVCGTFGKYGVLSFNGNKMITTSGGGALICPDADAKKEIMYYATQAREAYPYYQHTDIGYNYRMSNICAGIGRGQMTIINEHIAHHRHVQALYEELLKGVEGIEMHSQPEGGRYDSNYWLCTMTLSQELKVVGQEHAYEVAIQGAVGGAAGVTHQAKALHTDCEPNANVEAMRMALDKAGIESRPLWKPMHKQPVYKDAPAYVNGVSESLFKVGMCLPAGPHVTDDDVKYIVEEIKKAIIR